VHVLEQWLFVYVLKELGSTFYRHNLAFLVHTFRNRVRMHRIAIHEDISIVFVSISDAVNSGNRGSNPRPRKETHNFEPNRQDTVRYAQCIKP
jgi:hypothetical protein